MARTHLTVGDKVKEISTGLVGYISGMDSEDLDSFEAVGLSYSAWFDSSELQLLELASDKSFKKMAKLTEKENEEEGEE